MVKTLVESRMFGGWFMWIIFGVIALFLFAFLRGAAV